MLLSRHAILSLIALQLLLPIIGVFGAYYPCARDRVPCGCGVMDVETQSRVANGEDTLPYTWSMLVSVRTFRGSPHSCGGTIISDSHILTAASCVDRITPESISDVTISAAIHFLAEKVSTVRQIDAVHIHPKWRGVADAYKNNIAILHLSHPLNFTDGSHIARACLPKRDLSVALTESPRNGTHLLIIGWGQKSPKPNSEMSQTMQQLTVEVIDPTHGSCADAISDPRIQFCAGLYAGGKGQSIVCSVRSV